MSHLFSEKLEQNKKKSCDFITNFVMSWFKHGPLQISFYISVVQRKLFQVQISAFYERMKICLFLLQLIWVIQGADAASMRKYINEEMKVNPILTLLP